MGIRTGRTPVLLSARAKIFIEGFLLLLALGLTIYFAVLTLQDVHHFQQQSTLATAGDVRAIRPWMTIPFISRVYHVPSSYLYAALNIPDSHSSQHITLNNLANRYHRPVEKVISTVQVAIQRYRKEHPYKQNSTCTSTDHCAVRPRAPGRMWL